MPDFLAGNDIPDGGVRRLQLNGRFGTNRHSGIWRSHLQRDIRWITLVYVELKVRQKGFLEPLPGDCEDVGAGLDGRKHVLSFGGRHLIAGGIRCGVAQGHLRGRHDTATPIRHSPKHGG